MAAAESKSKLSVKTLIAIAILSALGFIAGIVSYIGRPETYESNNPAANATLLHIVLAIAAVLLATGIQVYRSARQMPSIWLAPFSERAFLRLRQTIWPRRLTFLSVIRAILCLLLLYLLLWEPFRAAMQIVAAGDPAFTANAWGGPSYIGASLAHWLDGLIIFYGSAYLLHLLMIKALKSNNR